MFLPSALRGAAAPVFLSVAILFGANANAEECLPGVYDAQRGIKGGECYITAEMNKARKAVDQRSLISANRITIGGDATGQIQFGGKLNVFTSNSTGSLGFNIEANVPAGQPANRFSTGSVMTDVRLWNRAKAQIPSEAVVGSVNAESLKKSGDPLVLSARFDHNVHLVVVSYSSRINAGGFFADNSENMSALGTFQNLEYTKAAQELIEQQGRQISPIKPAV